MVSEGADKPRQVTVGLGHVVTIHPDVDGRTGVQVLVFPGSFLEQLGLKTNGRIRK